MTIAYFVAGYILGVLSLALLLGAIADLADRTEVKQPTTVRDPETGAVWTETKRLDVHL